MNDNNMTLDIHLEVENAEYLFGDGYQLRVCGDTGYVLGSDIEPHVINSFDINTGKLLESYDVAKYSQYPVRIQGVVCRE